MSVFKIIKLFLPPLLLDLILRLRNSESGWSGNYNSWRDAEKECSGYDDDKICDKVFKSALKVKNGKAKYERDSVVFDKVEYSWPLLSFLLYINKLEKKLIIADYGGSFGTSFFQNIKYLNNSELLSWNIIEQKNFVDKARQEFVNKKLNFYYTIEECSEEMNINTALFSSSLQYLSEPYKILNKIISLPNIKYIILDLVGILSGFENDRITIQKVSKKIYDSSYPCWFFNEKNLINFFQKNRFILMESFNCELKKNIQIDQLEKANYKGYFFIKQTRKKK